MQNKSKLIGVLAACLLVATVGLGGQAAQAAPSTGARAAAAAAAEQASPQGDKAALEAAQKVGAASLLYCQDRFAYYTPSGNIYTYIPQYEDVNTATQRCYLESGTSGQGVSTLQQSLKQCYGKAIAVDGQFGPATYNALLAVQRTIGVTIDGVYGPNTGKAMKHGGTTCRTVPASLFN